MCFNPKINFGSSIFRSLAWTMGYNCQIAQIYELNHVKGLFSIKSLNLDHLYMYRYRLDSNFQNGYWVYLYAWSTITGIAYSNVQSHKIWTYTQICSGGVQNMDPPGTYFTMKMLDPIAFVIVIIKIRCTKHKYHIAGIFRGYKCSWFPQLRHKPGTLKLRI